MTIQRHAHTWLWLDWERIDYNSLKNLPTIPWTQVKSWQLSISTTWTKTVTWVWFTPKFISFIADNNTSMSKMETDWTFNNWFRIYEFSWTTRYDGTNRAVHLFNETWNQFLLADLDSIDSDWFTLDATQVDFTEWVRWTCIW